VPEARIVPPAKVSVVFPAAGEKVGAPHPGEVTALVGEEI
jgi:hypothetical protein